MINVKELSKESLVMVEHERSMFSFASIDEILETSAKVTILENNFDGIPTNFKPGTKHYVEYGQIHGIAIHPWILQKIGFVDADKKGWELMYYYGGMKLLYRLNKAKSYPSFRFMSDYKKSYIDISCGEVHRLQNIMRFLTEDLEFKYDSNYGHNRTEQKTL